VGSIGIEGNASGGKVWGEIKKRNYTEISQLTGVPTNCGTTYLPGVLLLLLLGGTAGLKSQVSVGNPTTSLTTHHLPPPHRITPIGSLEIRGSKMSYSVANLQGCPRANLRR